jgi:hypothetical protein
MNLTIAKAKWVAGTLPSHQRNIEKLEIGTSLCREEKNEKGNNQLGVFRWRNKIVRFTKRYLKYLCIFRLSNFGADGS